MFSTLSPYWNSCPRSHRGRVQVERSRSKLVGYTSTSRFTILVVLGLVSFVCAAPLQPEPTPTTTPTLVTSTLNSASSSSSSSLSSSLSTAIALTPSFVPRTNQEASKNSKSQTFAVKFIDQNSNDNGFIQEPVRKLLKLANIEVSDFIGAPEALDPHDHGQHYFNLLQGGKIQYSGAIDESGLCGYLTVVHTVNGQSKIITVFKVEDNEVSYWIMLAVCFLCYLH
ncbi:hypothetical protein F5890DRAFT_584870 [Lentinula detonsa]|uniref:Uncharacterized protein n=1 Tax=Lentinula detonsa TaxID=2804962 RepID=A0AA38Q5X3_9AGAR|nr:hypothetical protein F5890DRAFT_584870 [Lentinula detonsa]